jgi:hypothetical protein
LFVEWVVAFVVVALVTETEPPALTTPSSEAVAVGLSVMSARFVSKPTKPPPEPLEVAAEVPSPSCGTIVVSGTPPGPVICCVPVTPLVMSIFSASVPEKALMSDTGVKPWPGALPERPLVSRWIAVPAIAFACVVASLMVSSSTLMT